VIAEDQKQDLRDRNPVSAVAGKWVALRTGGRHGRLVGPCPMHSPNPMAKDSTSFECDAEGWVCATCQDGGDVFKLVMPYESCSFTEAVSFLGGEQEVDPEVAERRRREIEAQKAKQEAEERRKRERDLTRCESIFDRAKDIADTQAAAYLEARGLRVEPSWTFDLRYARRLPYHGVPDEESNRPENLGSFPAMVAAIHVYCVQREPLDTGECALEMASERCCLTLCAAIPFFALASATRF
jgi:DNA primase